MSTADSTPEALQERLNTYITGQGLKASRQRSLIADVFFRAGGHLSVEDLLEQARQIDGKVSQATVYRTMKLLRECGLASPRHFLEGHTLWELADIGEDHHDHLICRACDAIVEFVDDDIERRQESIAKGHGLKLAEHRMELYGDPLLDAAGKCERCGLVPPRAG